ncbi:hypothetical protein LXA43DRAFT_1067132 [Ganoderma leucocontextum]|nr:hypothetical protein LXA43DRAFT_1067132 [Ganoderma leucocontextum]
MQVGGSPKALVELHREVVKTIIRKDELVLSETHKDEVLSALNELTDPSSSQECMCTRRATYNEGNLAVVSTQDALSPVAPPEDDAHTLRELVFDFDGTAPSRYVFLTTACYLSNWHEDPFDDVGT